jgi:hypothetical protein
VSVDDTGARHQGVNGVCTQIGNDDFAWFGTTSSKSRLNFLDLLRAGHTDYVINEAALAYMREHALAGASIARLAQHPEKQFADPAAWQAHLVRLGITALTVTPDPVQIATEGALWGSIHAHAFLRDTVIVSDDAGQFDIGRHALCWVHAERLIHKLDTFTEQQRVSQQRVRSLIWRFYADLKAYRTNPTPRRRGQLRARFDRIFARRTGFVTLDRLLARLRGRVIGRARSSRHPPAHQWLRARHPLSRDQAQGQRWHPQRCRARLSRCFPRLGQDVCQAGHRVLGLSRQSLRNCRPASRAAPGRAHPLPRTASVRPAPAILLILLLQSSCKNLEEVLRR